MVDVYRETSWNEVKECIDECMRLREKANELREKWPEVRYGKYENKCVHTWFKGAITIIDC